jgi:hypothetical protein
VLDHLPERDRPVVRRRLRRAWAQTDHARALDELRLLATELERSHPGAAASLPEGMEETLTLTRLGIRGNLKQTLESTNPCESMVRHEARCERRGRTTLNRAGRNAGPGLMQQLGEAGATPRGIAHWRWEPAGGGEHP